MPLRQLFVTSACCAAVALLATTANAESPVAQARDQLVLQRGTLSIGGGATLTLWHDTFSSAPPVTTGSGQVPSPQLPSRTYFGLVLAPQLGYFTSPTVEFIARLDLGFEAGVQSATGDTEVRGSFGGRGRELLPLPNRPR